MLQQVAELSLSHGMSLQQDHITVLPNKSSMSGMSKEWVYNTALPNMVCSECAPSLLAHTSDVHGYSHHKNDGHHRHKFHRNPCIGGSLHLSLHICNSLYPHQSNGISTDYMRQAIFQPDIGPFLKVIRISSMSEFTKYHRQLQASDSSLEFTYTSWVPKHQSIPFRCALRRLLLLAYGL